MRQARTVFAMGAIGMLSLVGSTDGFAQKARPDLVEPTGEFVRSGPGFACVIPGDLSPAQIKALSESENACLRLGPFAVGSKAATLKASLGEPGRVVKGPKDTTVWVYFFSTTDDAAYLAASISGGRLVALQITGRTPADKYAFNGITLGATTDTVLKRLDKPMNVSPSSEANTDLWSYQPWTFSLEISGGRVTSIRIADPKFH